MEVFHVSAAVVWIEATLWGVLLCASLAVAWQRGGRCRQADLRITLLLAAIAVSARLLVPWLPFNWYYGISNLSFAPKAFTKSTTYLPLPNRLIVFDLGAGFQGIVAFNIAIGIITVVLLWRAAKDAGYSETVCAWFGLLLAITPMYVRLSASDATHTLPLLLWAMSAAAFAAVQRGAGGTGIHLLLFASTALGCPIRLESAVMMPAVPFFVGRDLSGWKEIIRHPQRFLGFWCGLAAGLGLAVCVHWHTGNSQLRMEFDTACRGLEHLFPGIPLFITYPLVMPLTYVVETCARILLIDPFFVPMLLMVFLWWFLIWNIRRKHCADIRSVLVPMIIFSVPALLGGRPTGGDLPTDAYHVIFVVFVLLGCARGMALVQHQVAPRVRRWRKWQQAVGLAAAIAFAATFFYPPYRYTYAYQEEFRFLSQSLPKEKATILTFWAKGTDDGDYDCCLATPYATFIADFPRLHWIVLDPSKASPAELRNLDFDYYYEGSLACLDPHFREHNGLLPEKVPDAAFVPEVSALNARLLRSGRFELWRKAVGLPANTFSHIKFPDNRMSLSIWRTKRKRSAATSSE